MNELYKPTLIFKENGQEELNDGDIGFSIKDHKIWYKNSEYIVEQYGGASKERVIELIREKVKNLKKIKPYWKEIIVDKKITLAIIPP